MTLTHPQDAGEPVLEIRPSLARSVFYAITAVAMAGAFLELARTGQTSALPAIIGALVLVTGAAVLLMAHTRGGSVLRLMSEGFEVREFRTSTFHRWTEVSPFGLRRRMLGTTIEFAVLVPEGGRPEVHTLPSGYTVPARRLLQLMNEWRDRALASE